MYKKNNSNLSSEATEETVPQMYEGEREVLVEEVVQEFAYSHV